jgi:hypothetical protein
MSLLIDTEVREVAPVKNSKNGLKNQEKEKTRFMNVKPQKHEKHPNT